MVLGLSRYSVLFTATERFGSVKACVVDRSRGVWIGDRSATARFDPRVPDATTELDSTMVDVQDGGDHNRRSLAKLIALTYSS